jgi:tripartite-type tricarboxylate transporter receptor subunit TctC
VPAIAETLPGFRIEAWYGLMGPQGMSKELVKKIHDDVAMMMKKQEFIDRIREDAMDPIGNSSEDFANQISADLVMWSKMIKTAQIKLD